MLPRIESALLSLLDFCFNRDFKFNLMKRILKSKNKYFLNERLRALYSVF